MIEPQNKVSSGLYQPPHAGVVGAMARDWSSSIGSRQLGHGVERCDVLVLGGGPAAAAAATTASRLGLQTVLVRSTKARRPTPVEAVPAGFADSLERLGVQASGLCRRGRLVAPSSEPIAGWHINRTAVEKALLWEAARAGVTIRRDIAEAPVQDDGEIVGLRLTGAGELRSRIVIDATGSIGWLRRRLGLRRIALSDPMIAMRGQVRGHLSALGEDGMEFVPHSGGWTFLVAHLGLISWTALRCDGRQPSLPTAVTSMPETIKESQWPVGWQLTRPLAGKGWFITGEAAGRVDPAGGCGLADALAGGARAARAAAICIGDPGSANAARSAYDDWCADLVTTRATDLTRRYAAHGIRLDRHQMRSKAA